MRDAVHVGFFSFLPPSPNFSPPRPEHPMIPLRLRKLPSLGSFLVGGGGGGGGIASLCSDKAPPPPPDRFLLFIAATRSSLLPPSYTRCLLWARLAAGSESFPHGSSSLFFFFSRERLLASEQSGLSLPSAISRRFTTARTFSTRPAYFAPTGESLSTGVRVFFGFLFWSGRMLCLLTFALCRQDLRRGQLGAMIQEVFFST